MWCTFAVFEEGNNVFRPGNINVGIVMTKTGFDEMMDDGVVAAKVPKK